MYLILLNLFDASSIVESLSFAKTEQTKSKKELKRIKKAVK